MPKLPKKHITGTKIGHPVPKVPSERKTGTKSRGFMPKVDYKIIR